MATAEDADWVAPNPMTTSTTTSTKSVVAVRLFTLIRSARSLAAARTLAMDVTFDVIRPSLLS